MPVLSSSPATTMTIHVKDDNVPNVPFASTYSHLIKLLATSNSDRESTYSLLFNLGEARVTLALSPLYMDNTSNDRRQLIGNIMMQMMADLEHAMAQLENFGFSFEEED